MKDRMIIGRHTSGVFAYLKISEESLETIKHLRDLSTTEQVEIYCLLEDYILETARNEDEPHTTLNLAYETLASFSTSQQFQDELKRVGIKTSIDRVRLGKKLRL